MTDKITEQLRTLQDAAENPSGEWVQFRSRRAPTVEPVANRLMAVCERLANTPMEMSLGDWGECSVVTREAASTISALVAERDEARKELAVVAAERDRAQKACEQIAKRFTPRRLRYAPKDRTIIGVERPPYEETTLFYDWIWDESRQNFVVPYINAFNGASHFLDPRDLIGLPPQERLSREERKKANARAALEPPHEA
jgi:hypothetical protein